MALKGLSLGMGAVQGQCGYMGMAICPLHLTMAAVGVAGGSGVLSGSSPCSVGGPDMSREVRKSTALLQPDRRKESSRQSGHVNYYHIFLKERGGQYQ